MDDGAAIVAERHVIERSCGEYLGIAFLHEGRLVNAEVAEDVLCIIGIVALGHHVGEELAHMAELHAAENVIGVAGGGIHLGECIHGAEHRARHHLVAEHHGLGARQKHVVDAGVVRLGVGLGRTGGDVAGDGVDLVEGEPVLALAADALEQCAAKLEVAVDNVAIFPAVVLLGKVSGHFIVADGDQRLDVLGEQIVDDVLIELQTLFVGGLFVARGEDAAPRDGEAVHAVAHLGHIVDILAPAVIEVHGLMAGVVAVIIDGGDGALGERLAHKEAAVHRGAAAIGHLERDLAWLLLVAVGLEIARKQAAATLTEATLALEVGGGAAPEKTVGDVQCVCHGGTFPVRFDVASHLTPAVAFEVFN